MSEMRAAGHALKKSESFSAYLVLEMPALLMALIISESRNWSKGCL